MPVSSRRSVLTAGAWSAPAVVLAGGAPAFAASPTATVHSLNLSGTGGPPLSQTVSHATAGSFKVSGSLTSVGSMEASGSPDTSFVVGNSGTLGGNAAWLYQRRQPITTWSQTYGARRQYTVGVQQMSGATARDFQFTVGRVNSTWSNSTGTRIVSVIGAIRAVTPGVVVASYGSNLFRVAATTDVPEHHVANTASTGLQDSSTCITFMAPGPLTSITFEVWNKSTTSYTGYAGQTVHVGQLRVTSDV